MTKLLVTKFVTPLISNILRFHISNKFCLYWQIKKMKVKDDRSKGKDNINTHSGSKYPGVPATTVDT